MNQGYIYAYCISYERERFYKLKNYAVSEKEEKKLGGLGGLFPVVIMNTMLEYSRWSRIDSDILKVLVGISFLNWLRDAYVKLF